MPDTDDAPKWRIIFTDSEGPTGVAQVCPKQDDLNVHSSSDGHTTYPDPQGVYDDCCPQPHLECWSRASAQAVLAALNDAYAEPCS